MNLTDVDRRLERAKEIRTRLADEVARFLASEPFGTVERYDSGGMFWVDVFARRPLCRPMSGESSSANSLTTFGPP